jgi:hypothetical protein
MLGGLNRRAAALALRACGPVIHLLLAPLLMTFAGACGGPSGESGYAADDTNTASGAPRGSAGDAGEVLLHDGVSADAGACNRIRIGILGNPGAYTSADFQAWLSQAGTSVQRIQTTAPTAPITAAALQAFDVVILDRLTRDYTSDEASAVASFVSAGGGLVSMTGYTNVPAIDWRANSLIAPLGLAYTGQVLNGPGQPSLPVTSFANFPITAGLTSVTFLGGYGITQVAGNAGNASTRTPIAFLPGSLEDPGNITVGYAVQLGTGHAFVWGDEWIEYDSEWSTLLEIKRLWVQVFAWVAPQNSCGLVPH